TEMERSQFADSLNAYFDAGLIGNRIAEIPGAGKFLGDVMNDSKTAYAFATGSLREPDLRKLESLDVPYNPELLVTASEFETREEIMGGAIAAARSVFSIAEFSRTVSIGDGRWDLLAARALGIEFIGIAACGRAKTLKDAGAMTVHPDFCCEGLLNFLQTAKP